MVTRRGLLRKAHNYLRAAQAARRLGWHEQFFQRMQRVAELRREALKYPKKERVA